MTVNTYCIHITHTVSIGELSLIIVNIPKNNDYMTTYSNTKLRIKDEVNKFLFYGQVQMVTSCFREMLCY